MTFDVYILLCDNGSFYTGYTKDLPKRIKLHTNGYGAKYTRMHKPQEIVYVECFSLRSEAMKREKQIKKLKHHQKQELVDSKKRRNIR